MPTYQRHKDFQALNTLLAANASSGKDDAWKGGVQYSFLNNAATALIMAPVAAGLATRLGLNADPFLMAVAIGAACDFLTPIGHQCNTLVMGPGGYHFGDYWRLGLPLSLVVLAVGTPLIAFFWPV